MRLLNVHTKKLEEFFDSAIPKYAILSHRWGSKEVTFQDLNVFGSGDWEPAAVARHGPGLLKIVYTCSQAVKDDLGYVWIDTCCIDKTCSAELNEAINSMFSLFQLATTCYVYLSDMLPSSEIEKSLEYDGPFPPVSMVYTGLDTVGTHRSTRFTLLRLRVEFSWHQKRASG